MGPGGTLVEKKNNQRVSEMVWCQGQGSKRQAIYATKRLAGGWGPDKIRLLVLEGAL